MAKLTLIRGLPGSGKSSLAKQLAIGGAIIVEADMWFRQANGKHLFNPDALQEAHRWCKDTARIFLWNKHDVIVSNTSTRARFVANYRDLAEVCGAEFEVIRCCGTFINQHDVPQERIERMREAFEDWPGEKLYGGEK